MTLKGEADWMSESEKIDATTGSKNYSSLAENAEAAIDANAQARMALVAKAKQIEASMKTVSDFAKANTDDAH